MFNIKLVACLDPGQYPCAANPGKTAQDHRFSEVLLPWCWTNKPTDSFTGTNPYFPYSKVIYKIFFKKLPCNLVHILPAVVPSTGTYDWPCGCTSPKTYTLTSLNFTIPTPYFARASNRVLADDKAFVYSPTEKATFRVPFRSLGPAYRRGKRRTKLSFSDRKYRRDHRTRLPAYLS